jgi:UDP-2,4-diacetamido-2,4,6-trideoxy-beta-L-altropyranose hydrolase
MNVVVRADSSLTIGSGHVMRCLTLAGALRDSGDRVTFLCRELPGDVSHLVGRAGFPLLRPGEDDALPAGTDWLVVDHYGLDTRWESGRRTECRRILVVDDLADRPHDCDILLDQNLTLEGAARYGGLVPEGCTLLIGPRHALLRPEFAEADRTLRERDGTVRRILVTFGGMDATGETLKTARAIRTLARDDVAVDLVVGAANPDAEAVREICGEAGAFVLHRQVDDMARLMAAADLCVGAGGTTTWERAYLGLPTIMVPVAENQVPGTVAMAAAGAAWNLGWHEDVSEAALALAIEGALSDAPRLVEMGRKARALFGDRARPAADALAETMREGLRAGA